VIVTTIGKMLDENIKTPFHWIYLCQDADIVLYVGRGDALERLKGHLRLADTLPATARSLFGWSIQANSPYSLGWVMTCYTFADCEQLFPGTAAQCGITSLEYPIRPAYAVEHGIVTYERKLIRLHRPCLNRLLYAKGGLS